MLRHRGSGFRGVTLQRGARHFRSHVRAPAQPGPLPAAVWLFGSGLAGLVGVMKRRRLAAA
ncbi:MAG: VPLPA-CTERM sorting domain-containing protein [Nitrospira sp.]|nr:VPLPA-CTERM sorting domain-containing protein [Nitrospira sp.]